MRFFEPTSVLNVAQREGNRKKREDEDDSEPEDDVEHHWIIS